MIHADRLGLPAPDQCNLPVVVDDLARRLFNSDPENIYHDRDFDDPHPRQSMQAEYRERAILHAMALLTLPAPIAFTQTQEAVHEDSGEGRSSVG